MINPHELPNFRKGDKLYAEDLQALRNAINQQAAPGMFVMPGMILQRRSDTIGEVNIVDGRFGLVTAAADPVGNGEYVALNGDLQPVDEDGALIEGDPTPFGVPFTNLQQNCGCPIGARIIITVLTNSEDVSYVYGYCIDAMDQLSTLGGDNPGGLLGGSGSKNAEWSKADCSSP